MDKLETLFSRASRSEGDMTPEERIMDGAKTFLRHVEGSHSKVWELLSLFDIYEKTTEKTPDELAGLLWALNIAPDMEEAMKYVESIDGTKVCYRPSNGEQGAAFVGFTKVQSNFEDDKYKICRRGY